MKLASIFFTASAEYIRAKRKLHTNERDKLNLLNYFTASAVYVRDLSQI